jgi:hypothetical protein
MMMNKYLRICPKTVKMRPQTFKDDLKHVRQFCFEMIQFLGVVIGTFAIIFYSLFWVGIIIEHLEGGMTTSYICPENFSVFEIETGNRICLENKIFVKPHVTTTSVECAFSCKIKNNFGILMYDILVSPLIVLLIGIVFGIVFYLNNRCRRCYYDSYLHVLINNFRSVKKIDVDP